MTKEQREEQFRKMLDKATTCDRETGYSWRFEMGEEEIKKFLDFIESEVEKAKKEGIETEKVRRMQKEQAKKEVEDKENEMINKLNREHIKRLIENIRLGRFS